MQHSRALSYFILGDGMSATSLYRESTFHNFLMLEDKHYIHAYKLILFLLLRFAMEAAQSYYFHQEMLEMRMMTVVQLVSAQVYTLIVSGRLQ